MYQQNVAQNPNQTTTAWRAIDMTQPGKTNAPPQSQQRNGSSRFSTQPNQNFDTIIHPSIIKTNNLMMENT